MLRMILRRPLPKTILDLALLCVLLGVFFGASLGGRPYSAPSESRYIEIGREMAQSGDYVTPRLDYVKYFEKPPLFYWIQAGATRLWGVSPLKSRIPTAGFAIGFCLLAYALGSMLYGRTAGWFSAFTLATTLYIFALSRIVLLDVPVSVFIVATLVAFLYAADAPDSRKRTLVLYSMYIAAACAVLTKGLIGAVLPGTVIALWLTMTGRWNIFGRLKLISGIALFLLICVPWHILVSARNPEFAHFYFIHEHWERYTSRVHGRYQPDWFFLAVLVAGLFPWIAFALQAARNGLQHFWQERKQDGKSLFLVIWILLILVFFSLSDSKLIPYILPIFPPLAVLIGRYLALRWDDRPAAGFVAGVWIMVGMLTLVSLTPMLLQQIFDENSKIFLAVQLAGDDANYLCIAAIIGAALLIIVYIQGHARHVIISMFIIAAVIMEMGDKVATHYNKDSMEKFAGEIKALDAPGDEVFTYENYYQDLPVYLGRKVAIVNWKGELEFGAQYQDTSAWMMSRETFWPQWMKGDVLMFMVMREQTFLNLIDEKTMNKHTLQNDIQKASQARHLYVIEDDGQNILIMNQLPKMRGQ